MRILLPFALLLFWLPAGALDESLSFDKTKYGVSAGESAVIGYSLPRDGQVDIICEGGWSAAVHPRDARCGDITVTAPDPATGAKPEAVVSFCEGGQARRQLPIMVKDPYTESTRPKTNLMIFGGLANTNTTREDYQKLAEAGFTMTTLEGGDPMDMDNDGRIDDTDRLETIRYKLGLIKSVGLKYSLHHPVLAESIELVRDDPDLTMIHIYDEPGLWLIPDLNRRKTWVKSVAPDVPVHINLCPSGSIRALGTDYYRDYVQTMVDGCDMDILSFDMYPIMDDRTIMNDWYKCMEVNSDIARTKGIPFWPFTACFYQESEHRHYPDLANMRLQVYTDLAYGASVVQYFLYRAYNNETRAPIMLDGSYTDLYDLVKDFNAEVHRRGYVFAGGKVSKTRFTGLTPICCLPLTSGDLPAEISYVGTDRTALVSFVENGGNEYVVVVNGSCFEKCNVEVELSSMAYTIDRTGAFTEHQQGKAEFVLDEGDMLVVKYR